VHASQLRLASGFKGPIITQLPSDVSQLRFLQQILGTQMVTRGTNQVAEVRVTWSEFLATWEDYTALKQGFLQAPTWGQVGFQEPGNVRTNDHEDSNE
jgi:hypothetical protein